MYGFVILVALFTAVACNAQEMGSDVGASDEPAAEVAGDVVEALDFDVAAAPDVEAAAAEAQASAGQLLEDGQASGQQALADTKESAQQAAADAATGLDNPLAAADDAAAMETPAK
jgi:hypothetical protein